MARMGRGERGDGRNGGDQISAVFWLRESFALGLRATATNYARFRNIRLVACREEACWLKGSIVGQEGPPLICGLGGRYQGVHMGPRVARGAASELIRDSRPVPAKSGKNSADNKNPHGSVDELGPSARLHQGRHSRTTFVIISGDFRISRRIGLEKLRDGKGRNAKTSNRRVDRSSGFKSSGLRPNADGAPANEVILYDGTPCVS